MSDEHGNGTTVSMEAYVNSRFTAVETATKAALAEQKEALATALASQQRELAAVIGVKHDGAGSRREIWGYVIGILGLVAMIVAAFVRH
jgi:hypothetical protein